MKFKEIVGIDVSKETLDVKIHNLDLSEKFNNTAEGFNQIYDWVFTKVKAHYSEILFAFEHTGLYSHPLSVYLQEKNIPFTLIPGLELKKSMGMRRGKDDKSDAAAIALYAYRKREEIKPFSMPTEKIQEIKRLISLRERLVKQKVGYEVSSKEISSILGDDSNKVLLEIQKDMITHLKQQIAKVEKALDTMVKEDEVLRGQIRLITSIKGVGIRTALMVIALTNGFTLFENWRKFACYSGIAPFPNRSGTSLRGKSKVSNLANKRMKALLDRCATCAIEHNPEMRLYYERRIAEGKQSRSTINVVRNKLLARIFAVARRETPYVEIYKYAA